MILTTAGGCGPSDRYYDQQLNQHEREVLDEADSEDEED